MKTTAERFGELADLAEGPEFEWTPGKPGVTEILPCGQCGNPRRLKHSATCGTWLCAFCWDLRDLSPWAGIDTSETASAR